MCHVEMALCCCNRSTFQSASISIRRCCSHHSIFRYDSESLTERLRQFSTATDSNRFNMSFGDYRKLKKDLKIRRRIAGIPMAFLGLGASSAMNVYLNPKMFEMTPEEVQPILGMDPIMFAALCGVGAGVLGYLAGGALFTATWKLIARNRFWELQQRDEDFLQRLHKHRFAGINKYDDDYYGDKIMNLSDYRQWIRKQEQRKAVLRTQEGASTDT